MSDIPSNNDSFARTRGAPLSRRAALGTMGASLIGLGLACQRASFDAPAAGSASAEAAAPRIAIRPAAERSHANHGWLDTHHSFPFSNYHDPHHMGFRALRVINEDRVAPGRGFPMHPHQDMEILSYVLAGGLQHRDSTGNGSIIRPGEVQRMSAGTGVTHSEANASQTEAVHFLQIWILPDRRGLAPSYEQKPFPLQDERGLLRLVASPDGRDGSVTVHQDVRIHAGRFARGARTAYELAPGRHAWVQVARGRVRLSGQPLQAGDGAAVTGPGKLHIEGVDSAELLVFDLA